MAANIFDQFDPRPEKEEANLFDQFDEPVTATPEPEEKEPMGNFEILAERVPTALAKSVYSVGELAAEQPGMTVKGMAEGIAAPEDATGWLTYSPMGTVLSEMGSELTKAAVDVADFFTEDDVRDDLRAASQAVNQEANIALSSEELQYKGSGPTKLGMEIVEAATIMLPAIGTGMVTKSPGVTLAMLGGQISGTAYTDAKAILEKQGDLTDEQIHERAMESVKVKVATEMLTESVPVAAFLRKTGAGPAARRFVEGTLGEGAQEAIVEIVNTMYDEARLEGKSIDEAWKSISWSNVMRAFAVGTGVGGIYSTPGTIGDVLAPEKAAVDETGDPEKNPGQVADEIIASTEGAEFQDEFSAQAEPEMQGPALDMEAPAPVPAEMDLELDEAAAAEMGLMDEPAVAEPAPVLQPDTEVVPEAAETLQAQVAVMDSPETDRKAVYLPDGRQAVELELDEAKHNLVETPDGGAVVVPVGAEGNATAIGLIQAIASGNEQVKQQAIAEATAIGGQGKEVGAPVVTVRGPDGTVVQTAAADQAGEVTANAEQLAEQIGGTVETGPAEAAIAERVEPVTDLEAGLDADLQPLSVAPEDAVPTQSVTGAKSIYQSFIDQHLDIFAKKGRGRKRTANAEQKNIADKAWIALVDQLQVLTAEGVDTTRLEAILKSISKMDATMNMTEAQLKAGRDTKPITGRFKTKRGPKGGWTKAIEDFYIDVNRELQRLEREGPTLVPGMKTKQATTYDTTNRKPRTAEEKARKGDIEDFYEDMRERDKAARAEAVTPSVEDVVEAEEALTPDEEIAAEVDAAVEEALPEDQLNTPEEEAEILGARARAKKSGVTAGEQLIAERRKRLRAEAKERETEILEAAKKAKKAKPKVTVKKKRRTKAEIEADRKAAKKARIEKLEQGSKDLAAAIAKPKKVEPEAPIPDELLEVQEREAEVDAELYDDEAAKWLRMNASRSKQRDRSLRGKPDKAAIVEGRKSAEAALSEQIDTAEFTTGETMLETFLNTLSETDPYRVLINRMLDIGLGNIVVEKVTNAEMQEIASDADGAEYGFAGGLFERYPEGDGIIYLNEDALEAGDGWMTKIAMHEMIHAMTTEAMKTNNKVAMKLDRLRVRVIKELEAEGDRAAELYGFMNVDEFAAEAFTSEEFQMVLASIKTGKKPNQNLWAKFVEIVAEFLGIPADSTTALAEALSLGNQLFMSEQQIQEAVKDPTGYIRWTSPEYGDLPPTAEEIADMMMGDRSRVLADRSVRRTMKKMGDFVVGRKATPIDKIKDASPEVGLALSTMDQIIRNNAKRFRQGSKNLLKEYQKIAREKTRIAREKQQKAGKIDRLWREMEKEDGGYAASDRTAEVMRNATLNEINPDLAFYNLANKHLWKGVTPQMLRLNKERYDALRAEFNALPPKARSVYRQTREFFKDQRIEMRQATVEKVALTNKLKDQLSPADYQIVMNATEPADIKNVDFSPMGDMADSIKQTLDTVLFATQVKGPYFPLRRFGDNAVDAVRKTISNAFADRKAALAAAKQLRAEHPLDKIKTSKIDGSWRVVRNERLFETFETKKDAKARAAELNKQGYKAREGDGPVEFTKMAPNQHVEGSGAGVLLQQAKGKLAEGSAEYKALETAFTEMLVANSIQKAELKRNRVKGASLDMRRGFAERAFAGSWALADMKTSFEQNEAMSALKKFARTEATDKPAAGEVINELVRRNERDLSERTTHVVDAVFSKLGFVWYLMSPSYTVVNLSQPLLVAGPYLAAKYGASGTAELFKAYNGVTQVAVKELYKTKAGWTGGPENMLDLVLADTKGTPVGDMLQVMTDQGIIDATFMQELYESSQGKDDRALGSRVVNKTMDVARTMPQIAEVVNRVVVAKAAFNAEMKKNGGNVELATEAAGEAILQTQFDYSSQNKPRWFKGPPGVKSIMMFKMYAQGMLALMATNVVKSVNPDKPGDRAEGIKTLVYLHVSHTAAAGVLGGLLTEPIRAILWAIEQLMTMGGGEDEDWDVNAEVEMFLRDMLGDFYGDMATRGIPAALGIGGGERVSMEHMLLMGLNDTKSMQDGYVELLMKLGGPVVAAGASIARGLDYMSQGETLKGIESMVPKGFRDSIRGAIRYPLEGPTNWSGAALPIELSPFDMTQQFFGVTPAPITRYYEQMGAIDRRKKKVDAEKKRLIQAWSRSDNPVEFELEHVLPFNLRNDINDQITLDHLFRKEEGRWDKENELRFGKEDMTVDELEMRLKFGVGF